MIMLLLNVSLLKSQVMKIFLLLSLISVAFARDISQYIEQKIESESNDEVGIAFQAPMIDPNGFIQGPDFKIRVDSNGMNMPRPMESMPVRYPGVNMPGMGMMNSYPGYPGFHQSQGMSRTNACGCTSSCGMPCFWWSCMPCVPCPPCDQPTEVPTTTTELTTTTILLPTPPPQLPPQEVPTETPPLNNCPCRPICQPCVPWFPCHPCSCPCQTTTTTTTESTTTTTTTEMTLPTNPPPQLPPSDTTQ